MAAFVTASYLGVDIDTISRTLKEYSGTNRRFDYNGTTEKGVKIIDDYAHHPTEIKATLAAARNVKHNKLWLIFQPHTYTRSYALKDEFAQSFFNCDDLIITDIFAAREPDTGLIHSKDLVDAIIKLGKDAKYIPSLEECASYLKENVQKDDIVLTLGAGSVTNIGPMVIA
jgi:UDP-N-acetylmuramate--alanine ligase